MILGFSTKGKLPNPLKLIGGPYENSGDGEGKPKPPISDGLGNSGCGKLKEAGGYGKLPKFIGPE